MDYWFLDNLEKLVPIIIALLYFIGSSKAKSREKESEAPDPGAGERARKIQEEIRRKILERQGQGRAPGRTAEPAVPRMEPEPPRFEEARPFQETVVPGFEVEPEPEPEPVLFEAVDPYEEQRRKIEEKLRLAKELEKKARSSDVGTAYELPSSRRRRLIAKTGRHPVLDGLDDTASLRNAIVLKEVLDVPLALR